MSSSEQPKGTIHLTVLDKQATDDFVRGFGDLRHTRFENVRAVVEQCIQLNKDGASYYEKLLLLDGGTIALSLTLLGAFAARTPGGHVPRAAFFCCVCPAWALLLISIGCCRNLMASFHTSSRTFIELVSLMHSNNLSLDLSQLSSKVSKSVKGELILDTEAHDLSWFFAGLSSLLNKEASEAQKKIDDLAQRAAKIDTKKVAKIATASTYISFILLCVFAIKVFG